MHFNGGSIYIEKISFDHPLLIADVIIGFENLNTGRCTLLVSR